MSDGWIENDYTIKIYSLFKWQGKHEKITKYVYNGL